MAWTNLSQTWSTKSTTTTSRRPPRCKPIKGLSKTKKTYLSLLIFKDYTYSWKNMDWYWARKLFASRLPSVKTTAYSSSSWWSTSSRRWSDWILESKGLSSERFCAISTLVWWNVEEYNGKRRRKQEKISILYWSIRTRNSLSPSSSRPFRTQSHWSFTTWQCVNSGQYLRVHLSQYSSSTRRITSRRRWSERILETEG